jgi:hypothetical protein
MHCWIEDIPEIVDEWDELGEGVQASLQLEWENDLSGFKLLVGLYAVTGKPESGFPHNPLQNRSCTISLHPAHKLLS